jgi:hypothetical protein
MDQRRRKTIATRTFERNAVQYLFAVCANSSLPVSSPFEGFQIRLHAVTLLIKDVRKHLGELTVRLHQGREVSKRRQ